MSDTTTLQPPAHHESITYDGTFAASGSFEQIANPDHVLSWLTYVGNDERKLLTALVIEAAGEPLGKSAISHALADAAGEKVPGDLGAPFQFCKQSLSAPGVGAVEPAEAIALRGGVTPMPSQGFRSTEMMEVLGVPFAGALLRWSNDNPNLSLGTVFGQSGGKFDARAPLVRYSIIYDLLTRPETHDTSIVSLASHLDLSRHSTRGEAIERLVQNNIIEREYQVDATTSSGTLGIAPEKVRALTQLVEIIDAFSSGDQEVIERGRQSAVEIMANPFMIRTLYKKGYESSNLPTASEDDKQRVLHIVSTSGQLVTASSVRDRYVTETGRNISGVTMRAMLRALMEQGQIVREPHASGTTRTRNEVPHYRIASID